MPRTRTIVRARGNIYTYPLIAVVIGAVGALLTTSVDQLVGIPWVPWLARAGRSSAQALLGGVAAGMITAAAVLFWVRGMLVQLVAGQFSSRVLQPYLDSRFQRILMAFTTGTFVFCAVVLLSLPEPTTDGQAAPLLSLAVASLLATGVLLAIVAAIANTIRSTNIEEVVRAVADETLVAVRRLHPRAGEGAPSVQRDAEPPPAESTLVRTEASGWIRRIDGQGVLAGLPEGATACLHARVGDFAGDGMALCSIWPPPDDPDAVTEAIRAAVTLGRQRARNADVVLGIRELVDVATSSLAPSNPDSTAGLETLVQLGMVVRELLLRDLPRTEWADDAGRRVLQPRALSLDDYVDLAFNQIRSRYADDMTTVVTLVSVLGQVCRDLERHERSDRAGILRRQALLALEGFTASGPLESDLVQVQQVAVEYGFAAVPATARS